MSDTCTYRCSAGVVEVDVQTTFVFKHVFYLKRFLILAADALQERTVSSRSTTFSHNEIGRFFVLRLYWLTIQENMEYINHPKLRV